MHLYVEAPFKGMLRSAEVLYDNVLEDFIGSTAGNLEIGGSANLA
jgi:hypothetical protein